ncbi:uncharacterized protein N7482_006355 [Penicillium canariense]|uniref:Uncharacterized protein n=1 Tax=Penicillium canariense TaxID=189055 RepID=A0A9W9LN52_9EURO|nr:uncharacterized protein N7482_006355 [Penicillium canariense]KAJ5167574.1 hypothetical protein N7482_006355 [Penicillium canariense]
MARLGARLLALAAILCSSASAASKNYTSSSATVHWLGDTPSYHSGVTFGLPWPQGKYWPGKTTFSAVSDTGNIQDLQSWTTGQWADGSLKWTGHAIAGSDHIDDQYTITASSLGYTSHSPSSVRRGKSTNTIAVTESLDATTVNTGQLTVSFPKEGNIVVSAIKTAKGKTIAENGRLVLQSQNWAPDSSDSRGNASIQYSNFGSSIDEVTVNQSSVRALVTVRGKHKLTDGAAHNPWLQFVLRFYLYANSSSVKVLHSIVFDGDADKDFITGLGIRFDVPFKGEEQYNRHVRIAGVDGGIFTEAVQGITGLRRDPGEEVRTAQYEGRELPDADTWDTRVTTRLKWIPTWGDYSLTQLTADGFTLKKRTKPGQSWVKVPSGARAEGLAYLGGATQGGFAIGLRDFWKRYPSGLDISNAASATGDITLWLYSPAAEPLDLRPFHDGLGEDGYEDQLDALEITYEDYEPGFNTPYGIARTSEIYLFAFDETPTSALLADLTTYINSPPVLVPEPEYIQETQGLGGYWTVANIDSDASKLLEERLKFILDFYRTQIEQRRWYGFLDYGDFMHTYDTDRHTWRYDVGGYAWDNSELSPDLFFWMYFLRTGREDAYRFAEALTRHTGEADVYHIGDWKGLGTRHGVQHWGDSAKQARISQPQYRKYLFYLSGGDERIGELLEELLDTDKTYGILDPDRKVRTDGWSPSPNSTVAFSLGTDWSSLAAGWLIEWERRGPRWQEAKKKLTNTISGIANLTNGFVTGSGLYDPETWTLGPPPADPKNLGNVSVSHLSAVFGLPEVVSEAIAYLGDNLPDGFKDAWLDYCYYYHASAAEQKARYGVSFGSQSLYQAHSRLAAYAAYETRNTSLALRAWKDFYTGDGIAANASWSVTHVNGSASLVAVDEVEWLATNDIAQYGLAVIQNLAYIPSALDEYGS